MMGIVSLVESESREMARIVWEKPSLSMSLV